MKHLDLTADTIDTRDLIEYMENLEQEHGEIKAQIEEMESLGDDSETLRGLMRDLTELEDLADGLKYAKQEAEENTEWEYGETLIRDSYWIEYTQDLASECYTLPDTWPFRCIDWKQAARELQYDYTYVEIDGEIYWFRHC